MKQVPQSHVLTVAAAICVLLAGSAFARPRNVMGSMPATDDQSSSPSKYQGPFPAMLVKSLDSKKLKEGDVVVVQSIGRIHTASGVLIPAGTRMIGHVTQAQARSKGDPQSSLAMVFDKLVLGKNEEVPIKGTLQAIGPAIYKAGPPDPGPATPGTTLGGSGQATGGTTAAPTSTMQIGAGGKVLPIVNSESKGALGMKGLELDDKSVITSTGKEVKLDDGTQMMIHVD